MTRNTKINYLSQVGSAIFFLFVALLLSCSAPEKRLEKERLTLVYRPQSALSYEIKNLRLKHPIKLSQKQVMNHLLSMHYEELTLLGKKKYVFSSSDAVAVTPLITKALNRMKGNQILYYKVETPKGATSGTIFQTKGKVHWRFNAINGVSFENSSFPGFRGSTWRLLPKNGQSYNVAKNTLGNAQQQNWIVSNLNLSVKSKRGVRRSPKSFSRNTSRDLKHKRPERSVINQGELKKRLLFLKELLDKQLINDEEYERKRKELLDQFL